MGLIKYNAHDYAPTGFRSFVDNFFNDEFKGGVASSFAPKVDVAETEKEFELQLHIPGVTKDEISIDLRENQIVISGERKVGEEKKDKNFHSIESHYGYFRRSFNLPDVVNRDKIDASYKDGILFVILPKDEKKNAKKQVAVR